MMEYEELVTTYFELPLLKEEERNVSWLLSKYDPWGNQMDQILNEGITGFRAISGKSERLNNTNLYSSVNDQDSLT